MKLQPLGSLAQNRLTLDVRSGQTPMPNLDEYYEKIDRTIDVDPLIAITEEAMRRYPTDKDRIGQRTLCDAWLAPRVHAALRLTRREAADERIWFFLAAVPDVLREYVFYRWGEGRADAVPLERFAGTTYNQTFARLWWMAELTRNGPDYSVTETAMTYQDIPNTILRLDAFHNRAFAIAIVRYIDAWTASSKDVNRRISKVINAALVTRSLDGLVPSSSTADAVAISDWIKERPDVDKMVVALPDGPADFPISEEYIATVMQVIKELCDPVMGGPTKDAAKAEPAA